MQHKLTHIIDIFNYTKYTGYLQNCHKKFNLQLQHSFTVLPQMSKTIIGFTEKQ